MDSIRIRGGRPLFGRIEIGGAKNAALPLLAASLLSDEAVNLSNLPGVADISSMIELLACLGVSIGTHDGQDKASGSGCALTASEIRSVTAPYDIVRKMRASALVLGPLLAREGRARVSLPGGCAIGPRPIDLHMRGLRELGATIDLRDGYIEAEAPDGLRGAHVTFPSVSVGATENVLMAATLATGRTVLSNAAREPEVADLAHCLCAMGARIDGIGSDMLTIDGVDRLHGCTYRVMPDRIETGTYAVAAALTGGEVELADSDVTLIESVVEKLHEAGVSVSETPSGMVVRRQSEGIKGFDAITQAYPGFPTDMQAQLMVLMTIADGASLITETIFENRFMHVPELSRMGANITVHGPSAMVRGVPHLTGAPVMATDLRASVSLVLAGLVAEGETVVNRVYHLDRGYEAVEAKLSACGALIERVHQ